MTSGVLKDQKLSNLFPNSNFHLFRELLTDGTTEYTLVVRTKETNMTTHRADVRMHLEETVTEDDIRTALVNNLREL